MSKRRRRRSSKQPPRTTIAPAPHFSDLEEEFFRTGDSLHEMPTAVELAEPERPSLWRRLFARAA